MFDSQPKGIARMSRPGHSKEVAIAFCVLVSSGLSAYAVETAEHSAATAASSVQFQTQVLPVLSENCFVCHGPDANSREADLRLDIRESATGELPSGAVAVVPGSVDQSEIVRRLTTSDPSERMPPEDSGKRVSAEQVDLIRNWVAQGAQYERHWAFEPVKRPTAPELGNDDWSRNPIDQFVLAKMQEAKLEPSEEASKEKLARRLYFDLLGLPPTPEQLEKFLHDTEPGALERLVDQLFESPHYGERMAAGWLDGARYADSNGYQNDFARSMWVWRDWVINAFNQNMPYDQFVIEQLAGDLLPEPTRNQIIATGFNRNNRTVTESGSISEEWLVENVVDRVETTSTVFLGLTMGCCRCHDHKYDPISQLEFYEFFALFNNIKEQGVYTETRGNVAPLIKAPSPEQESRLTQLDNRIKELRLEISAQATDQLQEIPPVKASAIPTATALLLYDATPAAKESPSATFASSAQFIKGPLWEQTFLGRALKLLGTGGAQYEKPTFQQLQEAYSLAAWVKPAGGGAIVSFMDDEADYRGADVLLLKDLRIAAHAIHHWPDNALKVVTRQPIPKDAWSHVTVTYDGSANASGLKIYVNGVQQEVVTEADTLSGTIATNQPLRIGQRSTGDYYKGELTDVRLFDQPLSTQQIQSVIAERLVRLQEHLKHNPDSEQRLALGHFLAVHGGFKASPRLKNKMDELTAAISSKTECQNGIPTVMVMDEREERRPTYLLNRGEYHSPDMSQPVSPGVPNCLPPLESRGETADRLDFARWLVDRNNPLTARVLVNRLWLEYFGRGLVLTPGNLGLQSTPPTHPQLLDWLAAEFMESGWDIQHIQRLILTSAVYRQSSSTTAERRARDPLNVWLARGPRFRLSAEAIRDNALALSGLMTEQIGGPSIMPYQPQGLWDDLAGGAHEDYTQATDESLYRRSIYVYRKRTVPHPAMNTFDSPSWELCQLKRETTNTPLQALALLNDVTYVEAARKFAERILSDGGANDEDRLLYGFRVATSREPTEREAELLASSLKAYQQQFQDDPASAQDYLSHGESKIPADIEPKRLAAFSAVASILLNLDETVTRD